MGFEPMIRVLQFCTVGSAIVEIPFSAAGKPSFEYSCTESPCEKPREIQQKRTAVRSEQAVSKDVERDLMFQKSSVKVVWLKMLATDHTATGR